MNDRPPVDAVGEDILAELRDPVHRDQLIEQHLYLARQLAHRFTNRGEPFDDLYQVASMALVKAADRFDPGRNVKFSTFAVSYIVGELKRHFRDRGWGVRAPRRLQELYLEMGRQTEELTHALGRAPTVAELADALEVSVDAVLEAVEAGRGYRASSLDDPNVNEPAGDSGFGDDGEASLVETREILRAGLDRLSPRERQLIQLRFVEEMTQSEIAKTLGISQMHVSRLLAQCLDHLRSTMGQPTS